jgi:signal peptidase II
MELKINDSSARLNVEQVSSNQMALALPDLKAHILFWFLTVAGLSLDLWTKKAVFEMLQDKQSYSVISGFLQFNKALNEGAAWGILSGKSIFLMAVSIIALVIILAVFFSSGHQSRLIHVALGFFASGVSGNLYDRIFNDGLVRDFIDLHYNNFHWPTFNVADSLLCIGVGLLIISTIFTEKLARKRAQQHI